MYKRLRFRQFANWWMWENSGNRRIIDGKGKASQRKRFKKNNLGFVQKIMDPVKISRIWNENRKTSRSDLIRIHATDCRHRTLKYVIILYMYFKYIC